MKIDWLRLGARWRGVVAVWGRVRDAVANFLVILGLCAIAYGVVFWWKQLPYRELMLLACVGLGSLPLGVGLLLRSRANQTTLALAAVCCALSGVLQLVLLGLGAVLQPIGMVLQALAWGGAAQSYARFKRLRKQR